MVWLLYKYKPSIRQYFGRLYWTKFSIFLFPLENYKGNNCFNIWMVRGCIFKWPIHLNQGWEFNIQEIMLFYYEDIVHSLYWSKSLDTKIVINVSTLILKHLTLSNVAPSCVYIHLEHPGCSAVGRSVIISVIFCHVKCFSLLVSSELHLVAVCLPFKVNCKLNSSFLVKLHWFCCV